MTKEEQIQELRENCLKAFTDCIHGEWHSKGYPTIAQVVWDTIYYYIKSSCYLKAERELPENPFINGAEGLLPAWRCAVDVYMRMLQPDPEGRVWASVYKDWE